MWSVFETLECMPGNRKLTWSLCATYILDLPYSLLLIKTFQTNLSKQQQQRRIVKKIPKSDDFFSFDMFSRGYFLLLVSMIKSHLKFQYEWD